MKRLIIGRQGAKHQSDEFKKCFSEAWLQKFPAPVQLRYDEEGFMRHMKVKTG